MTKRMVRLAEKTVAPVVTGAAGAVIANQFPQSKGTLKPVHIPEKNVGTKKKGNRHQKRNRGKFASVVKSADPLFNHEAAQQVYDLVMKCDTNEEAAMFAYFTMAEILENDIEANQRTLQRHLNDVVHKRIEMVKKALVTSVAKTDDAEAVEFARAVVEIEKAWKNPYDTGAYHFEEQDFRRDPSTGRFQIKIAATENKKPLNDKQATNLGIDVGSKRYTNLSPAEQAQYQHEYMQVANFLNVVSQSGNLGDHDVILQVKNKANGQQHWKPVVGKPKPDKDWDPKTERIVGAVARPTGLTLAGASYGLVGGLSGQTMGTINRTDKNFGSFSEGWADANGDAYNPNQRLYNRVKTGADFVSTVAPDNAYKVQVAARLASAVGEHGPQAEKVFGPAARKTAYRYRGVEKKPDAQVLRDYQITLGRAQQPAIPEADRKALNTRMKRAETAARNKKASDTKTPVEAVRLTADEINAARRPILDKFRRDHPATPDPEARQAAISVLRDHLVDQERAPSRDRYKLQLESGGTPPSEGFLLDKEGNIVTQAVGYGDDHYLPFNLRHLAKLRGGEYIRSRSVGGPTSEDIYTGLMAGAKRVTVVSRSGTFTVDFKDDFTGKRRYNDKAKRMVGRYEKLLDTVQSETLERPVKLSQDIRSRFAREVAEEYPGLSLRDRRTMLKQREEEYRGNLSGEREDFQLYAAERADSLTDEREKRAFMGQMMNDWDAHNEYLYRLNGQGYADALKALQEQFPYYIQSEWHATRELERKAEPEIDRGYVEPGRNRPTAANAGWHGTSVNRGTGFISASQTNYQRGKYGAASDRPISQRAEAAPRPAEPTSEARATEKGKLTPVEEPKVSEEKVQEIESKAQDTFANAATGLVKALQEHVNIPPEVIRTSDGRPGTFPILGETDETKIREFFKDKSNVRRADEVFANMQMTGADTPKAVLDAQEAYKRAAGQLGRVSYDPKLAFTRKGAPFLFPQAPYLPGADPTLAEAEAQRIAGRTFPVSASGTSLADMTDEDLNTEIDVLMRVKDGLDRIRDIKDPAEKLKALRELGVDTDIKGVTQIVEGERIGGHAKDVQRMRALNLNRGTRSAGALTMPAHVQRLPARTEQETLTIKQQAARHVQNLEEAAARLEESADPQRQRAGGALRLAASQWKKKSQQAEIDRGDFDSLYDSHRPQHDLAVKILMNRAEESDIEDFLREYDADAYNPQSSIHGHDDDDYGPPLRQERPKR